MNDREDDFAEIENIAENLLIGSKAYDIFPTPVDNVLSYSELVVDQSIDLSQPPDGMKGICERHLKSAFKKILGILVRSEDTVFLDQSMKESRKRFVQLHEVGHKVIPWQSEILEFIDDENTLDQGIKSQFEQEANYLASCVLFQKERFSTEIKKHDHSIRTPLNISKKYGASAHATIRRYVLKHHMPCALLVLNPFSDVTPFLEVRDSFESLSFSKFFGRVVWSEKCGIEHPFVLDAAVKKRFSNGNCKLVNDSGETLKVKYQHFFSTFNHFVFFIPS